MPTLYNKNGIENMVHPVDRLPTSMTMSEGQPKKLFTPLAIVLAVVCIVLAIISIALAIAVAAKNRKEGQSSTTSENYMTQKLHDKSWKQKASSSTKDCPKGWKSDPLLLISLDGFRADYLQRHKTSALQTLIDNGVHAPFMYPSYPSKTFPNHYSIVTGLYPQSHGIIDNDMFDPNIRPVKDQHFTLGSEASLNPQWWNGEPIWNTVIKNGKKAASYFWPGSEVKIQGMTPNYYKKYDGDVSFEDRVEGVIKWLQLPEDQRPDFVNLYFSQPDWAGHKYGPYSEEVNDQLGVVDSVVDTVMSRLYDGGIFGCVNTVIVSDHGMAQITKNITLASHYYRLNNENTTLVFNGPVGRVMVLPGGPTPEDIVQNLKCRDPDFRVYLKKDAPKRFHFTKSARIGDVIVDSDEGCYVNRNSGYKKKGSHGYDYRDRGMHALFIGHGPAFKRGYEALPFQNVELYNLFADVMNLKTRAVTDGTPSSLHHLLHNPKAPQLPKSKSFDTCSGIDLNGLSSCGNCPFQTIAAPASKCLFSPNLLVHWDDTHSVSSSLCQLEVCSLNAVFDSITTQVRVVSTKIQPLHKFVPSLPSLCNYIDQSFTSCTKLTAIYQNFNRKMQTAFYPLIEFYDKKVIGNTSTPIVHSKTVDNLYVKGLMWNAFYTGAWTGLQELTESYVHRYGSLIVYNGPIYDYDLDDSADNITVIDKNTGTLASGTALATHFYSILVRCDSFWTSDGVCDDQSQLHVLSFILPHKPKITNCQSEREYLYMHTARVGDIQRLTGLVFFADEHIWDPTNAIRLRTHVNDQLWSR